jgi:hypothetical protein
VYPFSSSNLTSTFISSIFNTSYFTGRERERREANPMIQPLNREMARERDRDVARAYEKAGDLRRLQALRCHDDRMGNRSGRVAVAVAARLRLFADRLDGARTPRPARSAREPARAG